MRVVRDALRRINMYVFFFNDTATTEIYTLSLHDALPISGVKVMVRGPQEGLDKDAVRALVDHNRGRSEEQRLNSSHLVISYAVFCLKKKKIHKDSTTRHNTLKTTSDINFQLHQYISQTDL